MERDDRAVRPLIEALAQDKTLIVGDNEPYDGALRGDTMFRHCMKPGIAHALIEIRQDEIGDEAGIARWVDRLAPVFARLNADPALHTYEIFPSRTGPY